MNKEYYYDKNEQPFSDFKELCMLQVKNGVTLDETYLNDKWCHEFIEAIAKIIELDEKQDIN